MNYNPQVYDLLSKASTDTRKYYYGKRMIETQTTTESTATTKFFSGNGTMGKIGMILQAFDELSPVVSTVAMIGTMAMGIKT